MKQLEQKYIDILEENDWSISSYTGDGRVELEKYSPAGEDFSICIEVGNFPESVRECANDFDADEHAVMWIKAKGKVEGIPKSVREIINDAEAIQKMLNELVDALNNLYLSFEDDKEKMNDFYVMSKKEFLGSYSYLTVEEYDATWKRVGSLVGLR